MGKRILEVYITPKEHTVYKKAPYFVKIACYENNKVVGESYFWGDEIKIYDSNAKRRR